MQIFIDSANLKEIEKWIEMGVANGVTTNPSIMLKDGVHDLEKGSKAIAKLIHPRPLSVEVTTDDPDGMLKQARQLARWADNIVIKVPQITSKGLPCYGVMHKLEGEGIKVNATVALSIGQVFIAAKAGATYISIFAGRVTDEGGDASAVIGNAVDWLENWDYKSKIIVGSIRSVGDVIQAARQLNDGDIGVLGTVFLLSIALFSFPVAYLVDRWSRRKAIGIMALLWSAFTFLTGKATSYWTLLIPRSLVGVGEAGFSSGGTAMVGAAYSSKARGAAMGVFNMSIPLGVALGSVLGGTIAKASGWQAPFLVFAIPGIILGILAFFMKDYKTVQHTHESGARVTFGQSLKKLFQIPSLVWVLVGYGLANIMAMSFLFWTPAFIGRAWGVDVAAANTVMVPIVLAAIVGSPVGGILADVWFKKNPRGRLYIPAITIILSAICMAGALYFQMKGIGMALIVAYGVLNVMALPCLSAISQDVAPAAQKGLVWGLMVFCMYVFGGGWSPYLVGAISDSLGQGAQALGTALTIASIGGVLGGICYFMASRPYPADMEKVRHEQLMAEK